MCRLQQGFKPYRARLTFSVSCKKPSLTYDLHTTAKKFLKNLVYELQRRSEQMEINAHALPLKLPIRQDFKKVCRDFDTKWVGGPIAL